MKIRIAQVAALLLSAFQLPAVHSADIHLSDFALNIDGSVSNPTQGDPTPPGVSLGGFDASTGLGIVSVSIIGPGAHYVGAFFDQDVDATLNTFFNELGSVIGVPAAGQTWEVDEPGFASVPGDIYPNFLNNSLDNSIGFSTPDDVSAALAYSLFLGPSEVANVELSASLSVPSSPFYLALKDPDSDVSIYYSGSISISQVSSDVPEIVNPFVLLSATVLALLKLHSLGRVARSRRYKPEIYRKSQSPPATASFPRGVFLVIVPWTLPGPKIDSSHGSPSASCDTPYLLYRQTKKYRRSRGCGKDRLRSWSRVPELFLPII